MFAKPRSVPEQFELRAFRRYVATERKTCLLQPLTSIALVSNRLGHACLRGLDESLRIGKVLSLGFCHTVHGRLVLNHAIVDHLQLVAIGD